MLGLHFGRNGWQMFFFWGWGDSKIETCFSYLTCGEECNMIVVCIVVKVHHQRKETCFQT